MSELAGVEQMLVEYAANAAWQLPLLAAGAWLLVRVAKPGVAAQHRIWLGVLLLAVALPVRGTFLGRGAGADRVKVVPASVAAQSAAAGRGVVDVSSDDGMSQFGEPGGLVLGSLSRTAPHTANEVMAAGGAALAFVAHTRRVPLHAAAAGWLAGLYLLVMLLGLLRLAGAWMSARRLVRESREMTMTERERAAVEDCARRLGVTAPELRESGEIAGPVVVGMRHPVLLWPEGFRSGLDEGAAATAALCHEMAHIRRRDYGMNLLCEAAVVPLKWHPVTYGVERRIRSTREMVCDAMAAGAMESETQYASCLVRLAESMVAGGRMAEQAGAVGLLNGNVLEERVMRLTQEKTVMSARARVVRGVAGGAAMLAAVGLAAAFYVVPAMAQTGAAAISTEQPVVSPPVGSVAPVAPVSSGAATVPHPAPPMAKLAPRPPLPALPAARIDAAVAPLPPLAPVAALPALPRQAAPQSPAPAPAPAASPAPLPRQDAQHVHSFKGRDGRTHTWVDGEERDLTPAERARMEAQLAEAEKKVNAEMAKLNSPEFRKQVDDAQRKAMVEVQKEMNSPEFKAKMDAAQKQIAAAEAKLNSPEFREQMQKAAQQQAMAEIDSAKFKQQMEEAQRQIAAAQARIDSPEFKKQMEDAARMNSAEIQRQLAEAQKQLDREMEKLKAESEKDTAQ